MMKNQTFIMTIAAVTAIASWLTDLINADRHDGYLGNTDDDVYDGCCHTKKDADEDGSESGGGF